MESGLERFTEHQAILPECLERPQLRDFAPGMMGYVESDAFIVDLQGKCWLDTTAYKSEAMEFDKTYVKLVRLEQGFVVELATDYQKETTYKKIDLENLETHNQHSNTKPIDLNNLEPVTKVIISSSQLIELDKQVLELTGLPYLRKKHRKELLERFQNQPNMSKPIPKIKPSPKY